MLATRTSIREKLDHQASLTFHGLRVRSRTKWFEQGEKSSSYFHKLIAGRRMSSRLKGLKNSSGEVVSSMEEITSICSNFYFFFFFFFFFFYFFYLFMQEEYYNGYEPRDLGSTSEERK